MYLNNDSENNTSVVSRGENAYQYNNEIGFYQARRDHNAHLVDAPLPHSAITQELRRAGASVVEGSCVRFQCQVVARFFPLFE